MAAFPSFTPEYFESIARELGELVTGTQLDQLFDTRGIMDISGQSTKWQRIQINLLVRQEADRCDNNVVAFIMAVMAPGRYVNDQVRYETARGALNKVLIFDGLQLGENGQFRQVNAANTISEAKRRADGIASQDRTFGTQRVCAVAERSLCRRSQPDGP